MVSARDHEQMKVDPRPRARLSGVACARASVPRRRHRRRPQHRAGARPRGPRLALDHRARPARRARRRRAHAARHRRHRRPEPAPTSSTRRASARCGARCRGSASPRCSRPRPRSPPGSPPPCSSPPDRPASTPTARRPRRGRARRTSSSRRSACSPRPSSRSSPAGTCTMYGTTPEALATVAATIRNNGHVQPRRRVLRARAVHRPGHPRQPHGRRPVPPARLLR